MAVPKEIIKEILIKRNNGVPVRELAQFLVLNNHTEAKEYKKVSLLIWTWNKKYLVINNELMINEKYNNRLKEKNYKYRNRKQKVDTKKEFPKTPLNKSYIFMMIYNNDKISKTEQCKINGVSYSGYKKWLDRGATLIRPRYDPIILDEIKRIYYKYNGIYGVERIMVALRREIGLVISKNTVHRYMKHLGLKAVIRKPKMKRELKDINNPFKDHIKRKFIGTAPDKKWYTDVSYIRMKNRMMYFSMIIDGFNNEIVAISISGYNDNKLVMSMLAKCRDRMLNSSGLILHSDRGAQYTSYDYMDILKKYNVTQSTSRVGNSLDNRPAEYFFSNLKSEFLNLIPHNERVENTTIAKMEKYINFYNQERPQSTLGWKSPLEYKSHHIKSYNK